jgi:hypothetical protein
MRRNFLRTLIVAVAALAAVFVSVNLDDLKEYEAAYIRMEMSKASPESFSPRRERRNVYTVLFAASRKSTYHADFAAMRVSPTLIALSTCILLC